MKPGALRDLGGGSEHWEGVRKIGKRNRDGSWKLKVAHPHGVKGKSGREGKRGADSLIPENCEGKGKRKNL